LSALAAIMPRPPLPTLPSRGEGFCQNGPSVRPAPGAAVSADLPSPLEGKERHGCRGRGGLRGTAGMGLRPGQPLFLVLACQPEGYPGSGTPSRILLALARGRSNFKCTNLKLGDPDDDDAHIRQTINLRGMKQARRQLLSNRVPVSVLLDELDIGMLTMIVCTFLITSSALYLCHASARQRPRSGGPAWGGPARYRPADCVSGGSRRSSGRWTR
jgi:hypothetical protein